MGPVDQGHETRQLGVSFRRTRMMRHVGQDGLFLGHPGPLRAHMVDSILYSREEIVYEST